MSTVTLVTILLTILPVLGIAAGLARVKFQRVPLVAAGLVAAVYGLSMAAVGIWTATCWDCSVGTQNSRGEAFTAAAIFFGLIAFTTLLGIWLGARLSVVLARLARTLRELRDGVGRGPTSAAKNGSTEIAASRDLHD